ncbi:MAG TPA: hypothetical protein VFY15_03270 [Acidimicrobiia bacterium]|nr:hypothetical protein [Acidimicrobiia bacterium]
MTEDKRRKIGVIGVVIGFMLLAVGVAVAHFTALPAVDSVGRPIYSWIPRCVFFESGDNCWVLPITGGAIAVLGSQIAIAAIVYGWIYGRKLTWALATVGAFLFTLEMLILLGIVPNQWLSLAQGTLDWSERKILITIPRWLVLNNDVAISYGTLKEVIAAGYSTTVLAAVAVIAYRWQERDKRAARKAAVTVTSPFGRPVVKGSK